MAALFPRAAVAPLLLAALLPRAGTAFRLEGATGNANTTTTTLTTAASTVITGSVSLTVPNAKAFVDDESNAEGVARGLATVMNLDLSTINVVLSVGSSSMRRRTLQAELQQLQGQSVTAGFTITVPADGEPGALLTSLQNTPLATIASAISAGVEAATGNPLTITVAGLTAAIPETAPTLPTIHGDPHVVNTQGDHFDIRRPGLHDLIVMPAGLGDKVRLEGRVTPLGGARCSNRLYFTEIHVSGSFLEPLHNLELSTSGHHFDRPDAVGLRVDGSANMSIPEFIKKVPAHMVQVAKLHAGMVKKPHGHADILLANMSLGPVKLKIGWAHTWSPLFNWMWLEITDGLSEREVGGLMGNDDFTWASSRPEGCP